MVLGLLVVASGGASPAVKTQSPSGRVASANSDTNGDQAINISDATYLFIWLFLGGSPPAWCPGRKVYRPRGKRAATTRRGRPSPARVKGAGRQAELGIDPIFDGVPGQYHSSTTDLTNPSYTTSWMSFRFGSVYPSGLVRAVRARGSGSRSP
jgi:hypothetical protein